MHDNTTNSTRLTVPADASGIYMAVGMVNFASNPTGARGARFTINGITTNQNESGGFFGSAQQSTDTRVNISALMQLSAGDYVTLDAFQSAGGALNITEVPAEHWQTTSFSLVRVG